MFRQASLSLQRANCRPRNKLFAAAARIDSIIAFEKDDKENNSNNIKPLKLPLLQQQTRHYSATPRQEMFLYAAIILVSGLSYVGYKTYRGEPLKPAGATEAQESYRRLEAERLRNNKMHAQKFKERKPQNNSKENKQHVP
mmetsp:Transcript_12007/g.19923  ORF Transcript_12007/g.19923 Transcript_12007/m.19923 type:complete len:141 (+) Transcript_12007:78-500(+)